MEIRKRWVCCALCLVRQNFCRTWFLSLVTIFLTLFSIILHCLKTNFRENFDIFGYKLYRNNIKKIIQSELNQFYFRVQSASAWRLCFSAEWKIGAGGFFARSCSLPRPLICDRWKSEKGAKIVNSLVFFIAVFTLPRTINSAVLKTSATEFRATHV